MEKKPLLVIKSLREQVYDYLRQELSSGGLRPGARLDINELAALLGVSRTPLRDALMQLEIEGFVTILPRRGVLVNGLTIDDIRHTYGVIGALEGTTVVEVFSQLKKQDIAILKRLNRAMREAVEEGDFDLYYEHNLAFHEVFLKKSDNVRLVSIVRTLKHRLYDWPRRKGFVQEWERDSTDEHAAFIALVEKGEAKAAAEFMRDVHWSFTVQERYIHQYYFASQKATGKD